MLALVFCCGVVSGVVEYDVVDDDVGVVVVVADGCGYAVDVDGGVGVIGGAVVLWLVTWCLCCRLGVLCWWWR